MLTEANTPLVVAAALSAIAALIRVGIVMGGAPWYRFFGAGERMASASAAGRWYPAILTLDIAIVPLLVFARSRSTPFLLWSSLVCIVFGAVHLLGLSQVWALV